jgi:hypothetical protein
VLDRDGNTVWGDILTWGGTITEFTEITNKPVALFIIFLLCLLCRFFIRCVLFGNKGFIALSTFYCCHIVPISMPATFDINLVVEFLSCALFFGICSMQLLSSQNSLYINSWLDKRYTSFSQKTNMSYVNVLGRLFQYLLIIFSINSKLNSAS